jgi:uncharacterized protein YmfQ (DUF2313 family)
MAIINDFIPNTIVENTDCLVAHLPNGRLFAAKNIDGSNLRKLYTAFAGEFGRLQNKIYEISNEDDLSNTTNLITQWENALQIPDDCFINDGGLVIRRKQVVAKFALMNILTEKDWKDLALFFGFVIRIEYGVASSNVFTFTFPVTFYSSAKAARFTMIVVFEGSTGYPGNIFTMTFPIVFDPDTNIMRCLFEHLKPANVHVIYRWEP